MRFKARVLAAGAAIVLVFLALGTTVNAVGQAAGPPSPTAPTGRYGRSAVLPDGRLVTPVGATAALGDFPVAIGLSPDQNWAVVSNSGQGEGSSPEQGNQSLQLLSLAGHAPTVVQTVTDHLAGQDTFYNSGVAFSPDGGQVYVTGGGNDAVYDYSFSAGALMLAHTWLSTSRHQSSYPATVGNNQGYSKGLAVDPTGARVYVTNEQGGSITALDTATGSIAWETPLGDIYPGSVAVAPTGSAIYVANQGANTLDVLDAATGVLRDTAPVGDHPDAVALTGDGHYAFVTNANDDSLSMLDVSSFPPATVAQISTHLIKGEANGSSPVAVSVDNVRGLVYVADAGDDAIAVIGTAVGSSPAAWQPKNLHVLGFVPTGWYPSAVAVGSGGHVYAVSAKGYGGVPVTDPNQYDGNDMVGLLNSVPAPTSSSLTSWTALAVRGVTWATRANSLRDPNNPVPDLAHSGQSPIKHVVLVVRENRTFDQVMSDLPALGHPGANVDPAFLEFGRANSKGQTVTPNAHDIALQYGLSDNFYSDGEASIQGHHWTAEGNSSDYTEKSWLHYYSNRNHPYDPTLPIVYPRCGALFQQLAAHGLAFRNFGELVGLTTSQAPTVQAAPGAACAVPGGTEDPVSVASQDPAYANNLTLTSVKDTLRLSEFERVYGPLVATNQVPSFSYALMGNDHTDGTTAGSPTPQALVATNDQAVGGLVDYLSHTPQWSSTAVFIMEDDSQDGLDHVDGHRNILLVASPYARHGAISHVHMSQASVLHTIELILGLPPLSTYTQNAAVPYDLFTSAPNATPYTAETPTYPQNAVNPSAAPGTASSVKLDLSNVDLAGPVLEAQIWEATHPGQPMPESLIDETRVRGGVSAAAAAAWRRGHPCACSPTAQHTAR
jgi:YVTN family beta-propeller protein